MFIKLSALLTCIQLIFAKEEKIDWDLAVVVKNEIKLLTSDGSFIDARSRPFSSLKALAYDGVRDQFIVSDTDKENDTIYTARFTKETAVTVPIMRALPGVIRGLAIDPFEDVLYWTDAINHRINYVSLNETTFTPREFLVFNDKEPHAIAIDICNRYMYYTNPSGGNPTIERIKLDKTGHEILVANTVMTPEGLAIDYKDQRLYWADSRIGAAAGRIESVTLDGKNRTLVLERNSMEPYGLAIDSNSVYWTDTNNNNLYRFSKLKNDPYADPDKLVTFSEIPTGIVTNNILNENDCRKLPTIVKEYQEYKIKKESAMDAPVQEVSFCLNGGNLTNSRCDCKRGFRGTYCELSVCHSDYCINGDCYLSSLGQPRCNCQKGFVGDRCQRNICDGYCLHQGECIVTSSNKSPKCSCAEGFIGNRCEYNEQLCEIYCRNDDNDMYSDGFELMCRCNFKEGNRSYPIQSALSGNADVLTKLQDPIVYLSVSLVSCLLVIFTLCIYIRLMKNRRPRIKKRIIVNKNVTPLTYRPQPKN